MGSKPLPREIRDKLYLDTPKVVRDYSSTRLIEHKALINSFTQEEFIKYDYYYRRWGTPGRRRQSMLDAINRDNISGNIKSLAELRVADLSVHQSVYLSLRNKCTGLYEHKKSATNSDESKVWLKIAKAIQTRCRTTDVHIHPEWSHDTEGLVKFLKNIYVSQDGKCALSYEPMLLEIGVGNRLNNKCSPDRIDSNKGYEPGNIQLTTWWANSMKSNMTNAVLYERATILYNASLLKDK